MSATPISLSALLLILTSQLCFSAETRAYVFTDALLETLNYCREAIRVEDTTRGNPVEIMQSLLYENRNCETGKEIIQRFSGDADTVFSAISNSIVGGLEKQIRRNTALFRYLESTKDRGTASQEIADAYHRQSDSIKGEIWKEIGQASTYALYAMAGGSPREHLSGRIKLTVTETEKRTLLRKINFCFGAELKKYHARTRRLTRSAGRSPEGADWILLSVKSIKNVLSSRTYEEAESRDTG